MASIAARTTAAGTACVRGSRVSNVHLLQRSPASRRHDDDTRSYSGRALCCPTSRRAADRRSAEPGVRSVTTALTRRSCTPVFLCVAQELADRFGEALPPGLLFGEPL